MADLTESLVRDLGFTAEQDTQLQVLLATLHAVGVVTFDDLLHVDGAESPDDGDNIRHGRQVIAANEPLHPVFHQFVTELKRRHDAHSNVHLDHTVPWLAAAVDAELEREHSLDLVKHILSNNGWPLLGELERLVREGANPLLDLGADYNPRCRRAAIAGASSSARGDLLWNVPSLHCALTIDGYGDTQSDTIQGHLLTIMARQPERYDKHQVMRALCAMVKARRLPSKLFRQAWDTFALEPDDNPVHLSLLFDRARYPDDPLPADIADKLHAKLDSLTPQATPESPAILALMPEEMLILIFRQLLLPGCPVDSARTLVRVGSLCRAWHHAASAPELWRTLVLEFTSQHKVDVPSQFTSEEFMTRVGGLKRYFIFMHGWLYRHSSYNAAAPTPVKEGLIDRALSKAVSGGLHAGEVGLTATYSFSLGREARHEHKKLGTAAMVASPILIPAGAVVAAGGYTAALVAGAAQHGLHAAKAPLHKVSALIHHASERRKRRHEALAKQAEGHTELEETFELPEALVVTLESESGALELCAVGFNSADTSCLSVCRERPTDSGLFLSSHGAIATMVVDFTQLPAETASVLIVANAVEDLPIIHTSFKINALTSGNLDNSFVCTEPLASYVMAEKGELRAYILAKFTKNTAGTWMFVPLRIASFKESSTANLLHRVATFHHADRTRSSGYLLLENF